MHAQISTLNKSWLQTLAKELAIGSKELSIINA